MARQSGAILLRGTIGAVTFYQVDGVGYAKAKRRAPSKYKYKTSPTMEAVRRNASLFSLAQRIAAELYRAVPLQRRDQKRIWYPLRNKAQELLRQGKQPIEVQRILR